MAYEKQTWADGEEGGTPITADRLNHIEDGVKAPDWADVQNKPTIPAAPTWANISGKPAVVAAGADAAEARTAIGAGTSNLALGTTSTTALKGDTVIPTVPAAGTAAEIEAGTVTTARVWSPKVIHDEIARQIAAIPPAE